MLLQLRCNFPRQFSLAWIRSCNSKFCFFLAYPMKKSWSNCKFKVWKTEEKSWGGKTTDFLLRSSWSCCLLLDSSTFLKLTWVPIFLQPQCHRINHFWQHSFPFWLSFNFQRRPTANNWNFDNADMINVNFALHSVKLILW